LLCHDGHLIGLPETLPLHSGRLFGSAQRKRLRKQGKAVASALPGWNVRNILTRRVGQTISHFNSDKIPLECRNGTSERLQKA
jgi:hypothetical protein